MTKHKSSNLYEIPEMTTSVKNSNRLFIKRIDTADRPYSCKSSKRGNKSMLTTKRSTNMSRDARDKRELGESTDSVVRGMYSVMSDRT
jgi:hypothetical protein